MPAQLRNSVPSANDPRGVRADEVADDAVAVRIRALDHHRPAVEDREAPHHVVRRGDRHHVVRERRARAAHLHEDDGVVDRRARVRRRAGLRVSVDRRRSGRIAHRGQLGRDLDRLRPAARQVEGDRVGARMPGRLGHRGAQRAGARDRLADGVTGNRVGVIRGRVHDEEPVGRRDEREGPGAHRARDANDVGDVGAAVAVDVSGGSAHARLPSSVPGARRSREIGDEHEAVTVEVA